MLSQTYSGSPQAEFETLHKAKLLHTRYVELMGYNKQTDKKTNMNIAFSNGGVGQATPAEPLQDETELIGHEMRMNKETTIGNKYQNKACQQT